MSDADKHSLTIRGVGKNARRRVRSGLALDLARRVLARRGVALDAALPRARAGGVGLDYR